MKPSIESSITIFKALSEITRLKILWLLINIDSKICVSEIIEVLKVPQYNVSRHLGILKKAGILDENKEGKWVYYFIRNTDDEFMHHLQKAIGTISKEEMSAEITLCKQKLLSREK